MFSMTKKERKRYKEEDIEWTSYHVFSKRERPEKIKEEDIELTSYHVFDARREMEAVWYWRGWRMKGRRARGRQTDREREIYGCCNESSGRITY